MAREHDKQQLRCRNSWRPSDGPLSQQVLQRQQWSSVSFEPMSQSRTLTRAPQFNPIQSPPYGQRLTSATTHATPELPPRVFKNPNLIPIVTRQSTAFTSSTKGLQQRYEQGDEPEEEQLPQIWRPFIDDLIRRTAHDYDLIMNYERDAEGGQRWLSEDIARIRGVGRHLHSNIFALKRWQRIIANEGDQNKAMMQKIKRDANFLKLLCERVQKAINETEQKCEFELLRDGFYAQDEDGNFYKPTSPQQYLAEGGFLQGDVRSSIEFAEDNIQNRLYDRGQSIYQAEKHHRKTHPNTRGIWTATDTQDPLGYSPQRSLTPNFTLEQIPLNRIKSEASLPILPRHSDKVLRSRISKTYQDPPSGKATPDPTINEHPYYSPWENQAPY
jgi:hypothetical protein